jgi:hypothetical protein
VVKEHAVDSGGITPNPDDLQLSFILSREPDYTLNGLLFIAVLSSSASYRQLIASRPLNLPRFPFNISNPESFKRASTIGSSVWVSPTCVSSPFEFFSRLVV